MIVAGDVYRHRIRLVRAAAARQRLSSVRALTLDAEAPLPFAESSFDRVLVDAPCSGTGTLRHNPEIRWRITTLISRNLRRARKRFWGTRRGSCGGEGGGLLDLFREREEDEDVVEDFLSRNDEFNKSRPRHFRPYQPPPQK